MRHRTTNDPAQLNFAYENKIQRKFSPLYAKRIANGWKEKTILQLPNYIDHSLIDIFKATSADNVADFCLEMYRGMGLLEGIKVVRSGSPEFRNAACEIEDFYVDVQRDNEIVRARFAGDVLKLHEGGDVYTDLPMVEFSKEQISPARDTRLRWMQSVIHCTHYVAGAGEQDYLRKEDAPEIEFVTRDNIELSDEACVELADAIEPRRLPLSTNDSPLLIFGAHPDDIEFGCGGVVALETRSGRKAHCVVCSLGEAASNGTPELRAAESRAATELLGATIEFVELDGDARLEIRTEHTIKLARVIRQIRPLLC